MASTEGMRGVPELVDAMIKVPQLITDGLRVLEKYTQRPREPALADLGPILIAGSCMVTGAMAMGFRFPWPVWSTLFLFAFILAARRK